MKEFCAELHIHSCLSPCADDDMTPANIAGMCVVAGVAVAALTDHNSTANCPAFFTACEAHGIVPVAGVEVTTAEDIHLVGLFPTLDSAMLFHEQLYAHRMHIENRPQIFGHQVLMDAFDRAIGEEGELLIPATDLSLEAAVDLIESFAGAAYPAHIDREANGILSVLGAMPKTPRFSLVEAFDAAQLAQKGIRQRIITASDAHHLWNIGDAACTLSLAGDTPEAIRRSLIRFLREGRA